MRNAILVISGLVIVVSLCGCAGQSGSVALAPIQSEADYNRLFSAASDVIATRFEISKAERDSGVIETGWIVGTESKTGAKLDTAPGEMGDDALKTYRRRAIVTVKHSGQEPLTVSIPKERLVRDHPDVEYRGKFNTRLPMELVEGVDTAWQPAGNDDLLSVVVQREIAEKYMGK